MAQRTYAILWVIGAALFASPSNFVLGQETKEKADQLIRQCDELREVFATDGDEKVARIRQDFEIARKGVVNKRLAASGATSFESRPVFATVKDRKKKVETLQAELDQATSLVAAVRDGKAHPIQHLSDMRRLGVGSIGLVTSLPVVQVAGDNSFRSELLNETPVWVSGVPTERLVDGRSLDTTGFLFEVIGTKRYVTVLGSTSTVFELRPLSQAKLEALLEPGHSFISPRELIVRSQ